MNLFKKCLALEILIFLLFVLFACTAEVGSEQWCTDMKEKSKADWTANEASDFAKHCIFK